MDQIFLSQLWLRASYQQKQVSPCIQEGSFRNNFSLHWFPEWEGGMCCDPGDCSFVLSHCSVSGMEQAGTGNCCQPAGQCLNLWILIELSSHSLDTSHPNSHHRTKVDIAILIVFPEQIEHLLIIVIGWRSTLVGLVPDYVCISLCVCTVHCTNCANSKWYTWKWGIREDYQFHSIPLYPFWYSSTSLHLRLMKMSSRSQNGSCQKLFYYRADFNRTEVNR